RNQHDRGNEVRRHEVRKPLDRRAAPLGLADHPYDLSEQRLAPHAFGLDHQAARPVDGSPSDVASRSLLYWDRLARDHGLVHGARAVEHDPVDGQALTRAHPEPVADLDLVQRHVDLRTVRAEDSGRLRCEPEESPDRATGPAPSAELEHLPEQYEVRDDLRGLVVDRLLTARRPEC